MNGYETELYESHKLTGGLCTSWKRGEYIIDGCLHWLTSSPAADSFYKIWKELGAIQDRRIHNPEVFFRFTGIDGKTFVACSNADRLENHMKELSPGDAESIELLCRLIRKFATLKSPLDKAFELYNFFDLIKMMWSMRSFMKDFNFCSKTTIGEFASRFEDPFIREVFLLMIDSEEASLLVIIITLALFHNKAGGFPEGGLLEFSRAIKKRLVNLGGRIFYGEKVEKILVQHGRACGIKLANCKEITVDYVISCADLRETVYKLLDVRYIEPQHEELFRIAKLYKSSVQVSFGINMDFTREPGCVTQMFKLQEPVLIGNEKKKWLMVRNYSYDP